MCGRYSLRLSWSDLVKIYGITARTSLNLQERYNIAPTQDVPIIRRAGGPEAGPQIQEGRAISPRAGNREIVLARWGLIPPWSKGPDPKFPMINARAETVTEKPAYREAFRRRRCLVPADGFYEWQKVTGGRQPWHFVVIDPDHVGEGGGGDGPMTFAGLWESWKGPAGEVTSFTIIVTDANDLVRHVHDRMPVIVAREDWDAWLDSDKTPLEVAGALLRPFPASRMQKRRVGSHVNNVRNDDLNCLSPNDPPEPGRLF
jgi:putative SOS response-associated peptidase YedK